MLTVKDIVKSLEELGVSKGDSVLIHSSFKSLGPVENAGATVVDGFLRAVGKEGTVIFPTLCKNDWEHVYENWHIDAPSDVGYLTNYFRKLPEAKRSNQATHSVAAIGKHADYLTATHGQSGLRYGIFGDTPFSADSPWDKMLEMDTKVVFIGVRVVTCTFRHLVEYRYMDECLEKAKKSPKYEDLKSRVWCYERWNDRGAWPHLNSYYIFEKLEEKGLVHKAPCGEATLVCVSSKDFCATADQLLRERDKKALICPFNENEDDLILEWFDEVDKL